MARCAIVQHRKRGGASTASTTTVRLDDVVDEDVLFVKIYFEGLEAEVLNGASNLLCLRIVRFIVIEFSETRRSERCPARRMLHRTAARRRWGTPSPTLFPARRGSARSAARTRWIPSQSALHAPQHVAAGAMRVMIIINFLLSSFLSILGAHTRPSPCQRRSA